MGETYTKGNEVATIDVELVVVKDSDGNRIGLNTANNVQITPVTETTDANKLIVKGRLIAQKPQKVTVTGNTIVLTDNVFNAQVVQILQGGVVTYSKKYSAAEAAITAGKHHIVVEDEYLTFNVADDVTAAIEYNDVSGVLEFISEGERKRKSFTVFSSAQADSTEIAVTSASDEDRVKSYTPPISSEDAHNEPFVLECYSAIYNAAGLIIGYERISYPNCLGTPVSFSSQDDTFRAPEYTINSAPDSHESPYKIEYVPRLPVVAE